MNKHSWAALAVAAMAAVVLAGCSKSPETVVEKFYRAVGAGETAQAREYMSRQVVDLLGETKVSAGIQAETESIKRCGGIHQVTSQLLGDEQERHGTTTVSYDGNCPTRTEKTKLVQEHGDWKLTLAK